MQSFSRAAFVLALLATMLPCALRAQGPAALDLTQLELPDGFLELSNVVAYGSAGGGVTALATTSLLGASAEVLVVMDPAVAGRRQWLLGIQPADWSLTDAFPSLSNPVLDGFALSGVTLVATNRDALLDSYALPDDEYWFYQPAFQRDDFSLQLTPGLNLFATIPTAALPEDSPLRAVMGALGIEQGGIFLHGTLGQSLTMLRGGGGAASAVRDLYLRAELPQMRPPGSPDWFRGGQLALELTGAPSVRLVGEMTIAIEEDVLIFFLATTLARSGVSLSGGLATEGGWTQPFGIPWLILNDVVFKLGITPTGSVEPGFAADLVIGEKDISVAIALAISPAGVPTNFMFKGESETGVGLSDLVELQSRMRAARDAAAAATGATASTTPGIPLDALPDMDFRSLALQFAPRASPELGVERGMKIEAELWLPLSASGELSNFAGVDVGVTEDGLWARGNLGAFTLGPLVWQDALVDLTATREVQHMIVRGDATLFGASQMIDLSLTREKFSLTTQTDMFGMFTADLHAESVFDLRRPDFQVDAVMHADFGNAIGPIMQQGIITFAQTGADVLAAASTAAEAAQQALALSQATADDLRRVLEDQRQIAVNTVAAAQARADDARAVLNSTAAARARALRSYYASPRRPWYVKAQRWGTYRVAHGRYVSASVTYNARVAGVTVAQRVLAAIPPVSENILMMTAEQAVAELRSQLSTMQEQLAAMEAQYDRINAAIARGEQLLVVDRAEFHGGLQSAMNGDPVRWDILGSFIGEPFAVHETIDFSNVGSGTAQMLQSLLRG